jgi:hypothetical protein
VGGGGPLALNLLLTLCQILHLVSHWFVPDHPTDTAARQLWQGGKNRPRLHWHGQPSKGIEIVQAGHCTQQDRLRLKKLIADV